MERQSLVGLAGIVDPRSNAVAGASATHGKWVNWLALGARYFIGITAGLGEQDDHGRGPVLVPPDTAIALDARVALAR